jgi:hypothetical protein
MDTRQHIKYLPYYLLYLSFFLFTVNYPFFWDTIQLASKHAHYFYESGFNSIILPNEIDSGHIPSLGIYIALSWKIFGKSLLVSHLAMLPVVLGIIYQAILLVRRLFSEQWHHYALIILLADGTLMAQCTLVSPDVLLVFFFLMAINNLIAGRKLLYAISLAGLTLASMRGMMCVAALFLAQVAFNFSKRSSIDESASSGKSMHDLRTLLKMYLPAFLLASCFLSWHYYRTGWIGYHKEMPWYPLFERVGFTGALYNILILGWRLIDFGKLFIWISAIAGIWYYFRKRPSLPASFLRLIIILACIIVTLSPAIILYKNLSGHRYLMPVYILFSLAVTFLIFELTSNRKWKKVLFVFMLAGLLTGNFWIYPDNIAKGWDSTLAYLPYFPLREKMMQFMERERIAIDETGTLFPNTGPLENIDLSGSGASFAELDLKSNRYVFYSNVYNGFSDNELSELKNKWTVVQSYRFMMVKVILYESPVNRAESELLFFNNKHSGH